jgi:hypothetical protein
MKQLISLYRRAMRLPGAKWEPPAAKRESNLLRAGMIGRR